MTALAPTYYPSFYRPSSIVTTTTVTNAPLPAKKKGGRKNKGVTTTVAPAMVTTVKPGPGTVTTTLPTAAVTPLATPVATPLQAGTVSTRLGDVVTTTTSNAPICVQGPVAPALSLAQAPIINAATIETTSRGVSYAPWATNQVNASLQPVASNISQTTYAAGTPISQEGFYSQQRNQVSSMNDWNQMQGYGWYSEQGALSKTSGIQGTGFNQPTSFGQSAASSYNQQTGIQGQGLNQAALNQPTSFGQSAASSFNQQTGIQGQGLNQQMGIQGQGLNQAALNQPTSFGQSAASSFNQQLGIQGQGLNQAALNQPTSFGQSAASSFAQPVSNLMNQSAASVNQGIGSEIGKAASTIEGGFRAPSLQASQASSFAPLGVGTR